MTIIFRSSIGINLSPHVKGTAGITHTILPGDVLFFPNVEQYGDVFILDVSENSATSGKAYIHAAEGE